MGLGAVWGMQRRNRTFTQNSANKTHLWGDSTVQSLEMQANTYKLSQSKHPLLSHIPSIETTWRRTYWIQLETQLPQITWESVRIQSKDCKVIPEHGGMAASGMPKLTGSSINCTNLILLWFVTETEAVTEPENSIKMRMMGAQHSIGPKYCPERDLLRQLLK
jgi:hypothetical protein